MLAFIEVAKYNFNKQNASTHGFLSVIYSIMRMLKNGSEKNIS